LNTANAYISCADVIMQSKEYQENRIHTGWLDSRIAMRVRVERPKWHISVLGGALYVSVLIDSFMSLAV
jgi:lipid-A-disaccharide synthase-like uncharacterized protein